MPQTELHLTSNNPDSLEVEDDNSGYSEVVKNVYARLVTFDWNRYEGRFKDEDSIKPLEWADEKGINWRVTRVSNPSEISPYSPFTLSLDCRFPTPENRYDTYRGTEHFRVILDADGSITYHQGRYDHERNARELLESSGKDQENLINLKTAVLSLHSFLPSQLPPVLEDRWGKLTIKGGVFTSMSVERLLNGCTNLNHIVSSGEIISGANIKKQPKEGGENPRIVYETSDFSLSFDTCPPDQAIQRMDIYDKRNSQQYAIHTYRGQYGPQYNITSEQASQDVPFDEINGFACYFISQSIRILKTIEASIPEESLVTVTEYYGGISPERINELAEKETITDLEVREGIEASWNLTKNHVSEFEETVLLGYEIVGKYLANRLENQFKSAKLWQDPVFRSSLFLVLQNIGQDKFPTSPHLKRGTKAKVAFEEEQREVENQWTQLVEYISKRTTERYNLEKFWETHPEEKRKIAETIFQANNVRMDFAGSLEQQGETLDRYIHEVTEGLENTEQLRSATVLNLGGGADTSPDDYPPVGREIARRGYNVINIDLGGNEPEMALNDAYFHIRLKLDKDLDLPSFLTRIGLINPIGVIGVHQFIDDNMSPQLSTATGYMLRQKVYQWAQIFEEKQGFAPKYSFD